MLRFEAYVIHYDMKSDGMSRSLKDLHSDQTRQLILASAVALLDERSVIEMTARAVARQARISERTVFRHYATRDELLDAVAAEVIRKLAIPAPPATLEELLAYPARLFGGFEAGAGLARAAIHSELFHRIRGTASAARWSAIQKLLDAGFPRVPARRRKLAAANIRYLLSASSWNYYRSFFGFTAQETVDVVESAIRDILGGLRAPGR